jgi:hypothetical protein
VVSRVLAYSPTLNVVRPEAFWRSLLRRDLTEFSAVGTDSTNLLSSRLVGTRQHAPILDLDVPHVCVPSTTPGHSHLYLHVPMSRAKWTVLQLVLWWTGIQECGYSVWSIRRGANCVRLPGDRK